MMKLPPQKVRVTRSRQAQRQFLIVGVSLILLMTLVSLLFFTPPSTGKAYQVGEQGVSLSATGTTVRLALTTDRNINGMFIEMTGPFELCQGLQVRPLLDWRITHTEPSEEEGAGDSQPIPQTVQFAEWSCEGRTLRFMDAALDPEQTVTGDIYLAEFVFPQLPPGQVPLSVQALDIWDARSYDGENLFAAAEFPFVEFVEGPVPVVAAEEEAPKGEPDSGGGGGGFVCYRQWSCGEWSSCSAQGKQRRSCVDQHDCQLTKMAGFKTYPVQVFGSDKPVEEQSCAFTAPLQQASPKPAQPQLPPLKEQEESIFLTGQKMLVGAVTVFVLVFGLLMVLHRLHKTEHYNYDDLKQWIVAERKAGADVKEIRKVLRKHTHWKREEVETMLAESV